MEDWWSLLKESTKDIDVVDFLTSGVKSAEKEYKDTKLACC